MSYLPHVCWAWLIYVYTCVRRSLSVLFSIIYLFSIIIYTIIFNNYYAGSCCKYLLQCKLTCELSGQDLCRIGCHKFSSPFPFPPFSISWLLGLSSLPLLQWPPVARMHIPRFIVNKCSTGKFVLPLFFYFFFDTGKKKVEHKSSAKNKSGTPVQCKTCCVSKEL